jgi:hypothetical protein
VKAEDLPAAVWRALGAACTDRQHGWRTPVLATVNAHGEPQARTVVLRAADSAAHILRFFTDSRSPKVVELGAQPAAQLVFWSSALQWQLRVRARVTVLTEGPDVQAAWQRISTSAAAGDYLSALAPGSALEPDLPSRADSPQFAILDARVEAMDWLALSPAGHRRARLVPGGPVQWLQA